jgi:transposase-like protein
MFDSNEITLIDGPPPLRLSPAQSAALQSLVSGMSVTAAAAAAGVDRGTVHRWLRTSSQFREAFARYHAQVTAEARLELAALARDAVDVVADSIRRGDARVALSVLHRLKLFDPETKPVPCID